MSKLPSLKACDINKALISLGSKRVRTKGPYIFYKHVDGRTTVVQSHAGEDIGRGSLRKILHDIQLTPEDFSKLL